jgi:hypothetical protein
MLDKYVHPSQADMDNAMLALSAGMATKFTEMLVDFEGKNWPTQDQFGGPGKKSK